MSSLEEMRKQMKIPKEQNRGAPRERGVGRTVTVKNKAPAPVQITAEQLLRESHEFVEQDVVPPKQQISDMAELQEYRLRKRQEFENAIRRNRMNIGAWVKYATWEASQKEFERARSVFERALDVDYRNQSLWLKYAEMEMSNRFVQHARNIWDRAVQLMPRVEQFWFKYTYMEEMLGNAANARAIFERWMTFHPDKNAWSSYIKFEMRMKQIDRARAIYERFLVDHNEISTYLQYAKFEIKHGDASRARTVYERAMAELGEEANDEQLFIAFASFEQSHKEYERARVIYKYALDHVPKHRAEALYRTYTAFEKQYGDREGVDEVILAKRRFQYEEELSSDPHNYDVWFDYLRLEESKGDAEKIRELYERAVAQLPLVSEKRYWQRYIYLWINWVLYEELEAKDINRTRSIYQKILDLIPHKDFTFSKIWIMYAHFEIRQKNLENARKILGTALGKCPRESIFKAYLELESQLANIDRCRKLYEKYLEFMPENCQAWTKYAELESSLSELDRARAIFNLAITQPILDMPEVLWKAYIDFEITQSDWERVRHLYSQLLTRTKHVKVWISRAQFEIQTTKEIEKARAIYTEADTFFKQQQNKEERVILLESWRDFEKQHGTAEQLRAVTSKMPKKVKKKRRVQGEDGVDLGWEEYYDYIFPDDAAASGPLKILEMARLWKKQKLQQMQEDNETEMEAEGEGDEGEGEGEGQGEGEGDEEQEDQEERDESGPARPPARDDADESPPGGGGGGDDDMED